MKKQSIILFTIALGMFTSNAISQTQRWVPADSKSPDSSKGARGVWVTTEINPSYKKVTSESQLPRFVNPMTLQYEVDISKLRNSTPLYITVYNPPPENPGPDYSPTKLVLNSSWAVLCEPDMSGKLSVHSVADYSLKHTGRYIGVSGWIAGSKFYGNSRGLSINSTSEFSFSGGELFGYVPKAGQPSTVYDVVPITSMSQPGEPNAAYNSGIFFDAPLIGQGPVGTSVVTFSVADNVHNLTLSNTCNVTWHREGENHVKKDVFQKGTSYDENASDWVNMNFPITITIRSKHIGWT